MHATPIIQIRGLKKQFNPPEGPVAVNGIDLDIYEGEIFSLLGPNGAGKTTTISMISGLLTPTAGEVHIAGHSIREDPIAAKRAIGIVPQELALYPTLSARQNLTFFGKMYGLAGKELKQRVAEVLDFTELNDRADDPVQEYSGGMKRRVNIGVGLLHRPQVIMLDEPTVAIDPQSRRNILDAVIELNRRGTTVLYTTHYMEEAQELSHRVAIIDHGEIIALGTQEELTRLVGEEDTLILGVPDAPQAVIDRLAQVDGVHSATLEDGEIRVLAKNGRSALVELIGVINAAGLALQSVEVREPTLEAVFLHLTGRALRD
ncbi:MAG TPA: ABC transporter ATP-binding protein [Aggregatilinea sp.]|uniref:ABC transporter ATP-binding protein n=1 Tax=Aggregatilinea sp. TaxID=2806333 RepID=UPI002BB3BD02|nr:ABC transporter ATP-binding protein [Aggregatilinea sp.]HML21625.1 ABC transporter ATP-binding protein [Aggregatilinea sp.]